MFLNFGWKAATRHPHRQHRLLPTTSRIRNSPVSRSSVSPGTCTSQCRWVDREDPIPTLDHRRSTSSSSLGTVVFCPRSKVLFRRRLPFLPRLHPGHRPSPKRGQHEGPHPRRLLPRWTRHSRRLPGMVDFRPPHIHRQPMGPHDRLHSSSRPSMTTPPSPTSPPRHPGLSPSEAKYAVLAGAVTGGGLTVIANAPNPAGQSIARTATSREAWLPWAWPEGRDRSHRHHGSLLHAS